MRITVKDGGAAHVIASFTAQSGDTARTIRKASVYASGALQLVFNPAPSLVLNISPSPTTARPFRGSGSATVVLSATPTGGLGPYSYSWSTLSFQGGVPVISAPSFAATGITQSGLVQFDDNDCTFSCTVTDSLGATANATVDVTFFGPIDTGGFH